MRDTPAAKIAAERGIVTLWHISPDAGDPLCLCSACLEPIQEGEFPLRVWVGDEADKERMLEARFHGECIPPDMGIQHWPEGVQEEGDW